MQMRNSGWAVPLADYERGADGDDDPVYTFGKVIAYFQYL